LAGLFSVWPQAKFVKINKTASEKIVFIL